MKLVAYRWSRVYITFARSSDGSQQEFCIYKRELTNTGYRPLNPSNYLCTSSPSYIIDEEEIEINLRTSNIILANFKFYRYAMNQQTIYVDMPAYSPDVNPTKYSFSQSYHYNYPTTSDSSNV